MGCKLHYRSIGIFIIVKKIIFWYLLMVTQEKKKNLEGSFWDSTVVKKERRIIGKCCFEIHGCIVMSNWNQNWDYLPLVSWATHIWIWILGSHESNGLIGSQFGVKTREIWSIEVRLCKVHGCTVTSNLSQNRDHLHWVSWGKPPMVLKLRKSRIKCFKQIAIWSWNETIETMLCKEHAVTGLHMDPIPFDCLGWILGFSFWAHFGGNWAFSVFYFH